MSRWSTQIHPHWAAALPILTLLVIVGLADLSSAQTSDAGRSKESWERDHLCYTLTLLARVDYEIREFKLREGRLPRALSELGEAALKDGWGNDLVFEAKGDGTYELVSPGPDHSLGTGDDERPGEIDVESPKLPERCVPVK